MKPYRFVIVGSGWRALYYVRIAQALPQLFSLEMMYCRTAEKSKMIAEKWGVPVTVTEEDCVRAAPDFVVNAVSKNALADVSLHWLARGFTVLQETPAAMDIPTLEKLWQCRQEGHKLVIAEQYTRYPTNAALLNILRSGLIGERDHLHLSAAHEYHAASLMRAFLDIPADMPFIVSGQAFQSPVVRTQTRYERFTDGQEHLTTRNIAVFRWENKKTALYDFDSEQYHSPIRNDLIRVLGRRGEVCNGSISYLDRRNVPVRTQLQIDSRIVKTEERNPNFSVYPEITGVSLNGNSVYEPPFGQAGLSEDETAIALMMKQTGDYARGECGSPYPLEDALTDAYTAILLRQALSGQTRVESQTQIWQKQTD